MPITVDINEPDATLILQPANVVIERVYELTVDSPAMYEVAGNELRQIQTMLTRLEADRMALTRPLDELKAKLMAKYAPAKEALTRARDILRDGIAKWDAQVQAEMQRERERLAAEDRERQRQAAEEQAARDEAARAERERLEREANELEAQGRPEQADVARQAAEQVAMSVGVPQPMTLAPLASVVAPARPKGISVASKYDAEGVDILKFAAFVVANPMFASCLDFNKTALRQQAQSLKENFNLPGCRLVKSGVVRARS